MPSLGHNPLGFESRRGTYAEGVTNLAPSLWQRVFGWLGFSGSDVDGLKDAYVEDLQSVLRKREAAEVAPW